MARRRLSLMLSEHRLYNRPFEFRNLLVKEHARREDQPFFRHLTNCAQFLAVVSLNQLPKIFRHSVKVNFKEHIIFNAVHGNVEVKSLIRVIIGRVCNSLRLAIYKEFKTNYTLFFITTTL